MSRFKQWASPLFDVNGWAMSDYGTKYGWKCDYNNNLRLGKYTDIGCFTYMNAKHGIEIGNHTQIGAHCAIYSKNTENETKGKVIIGKNCMIGSYTLILPNVVILDDSKIRARSILK